MLVLLWIELLCNSSKPEKERNVIHMFDIVCIVGHGCRLQYSSERFGASANDDHGRLGIQKAKGDPVRARCYYAAY